MEKYRGTAAKRGYDAVWRRLRSIVLANNPLCADCKAQGYTTLANEVHHVVKVQDDPSRRLDVSNLMPLCKACHSARTARGE
jgi:5-methylcytosine-specific restriction protein A